MKPYGWRLGANDYDSREQSVRVVMPVRARRAARREIVSEGRAFELFDVCDGCRGCAPELFSVKVD